MRGAQGARALGLRRLARGRADRPRGAGGGPASVRSPRRASSASSFAEAVQPNRFVLRYGWRELRRQLRRSRPRPTPTWPGCLAADAAARPARGGDPTGRPGHARARAPAPVPRAARAGRCRTARSARGTRSRRRRAACRLDASRTFGSRSPLAARRPRRRSGRPRSPSQPAIPQQPASSTSTSTPIFCSSCCSGSMPPVALLVAVTVQERLAARAAAARQPGVLGEELGEVVTSARASRFASSSSGKSFAARP